MFAVVIVLTVREPLRSTEDSAGIELEQTSTTQPAVDWRHKVVVICQTFFQPSLLVLCLAGSVRNAGQKVESTI